VIGRRREDGVATERMGGGNGGGGDEGENMMSTALRSVSLGFIFCYGR
jgi:hypothetical protein